MRVIFRISGPSSSFTLLLLHQSSVGHTYIPRKIWGLWRWLRSWPGGMRGRESFTLRVLKVNCLFGSSCFFVFFVVFLPHNNNHDHPLSTSLRFLHPTTPLVFLVLCYLLLISSFHFWKGLIMVLGPSAIMCPMRCFRLPTQWHLSFSLSYFMH